jgi:hypothetical protein
MDQHAAFRNIFPSVAHITEHALWRSAQAAAGGASAGSATDNSDEPRGMGLTQRAWDAAVQIFAAVRCAAKPGCGAAKSARTSRSHHMRRCLCDARRRIHLRRKGCPCHCGYCVRCNKQYCFCCDTESERCTRVLCTCTSRLCRQPVAAAAGTTPQTPSPVTSSALQAAKRAHTTHTVSRLVTDTAFTTSYSMVNSYCSLSYTVVIV